MSNNKKNNKNKKNRKNFTLEALEPEHFFFGHEKLMPISIGMTRAGKGGARGFRGWNHLGEGVLEDPAETGLQAGGASPTFVKMSMIS